MTPPLAIEGGVFVLQVTRMPEESISPHALKILAEIATAVEKTDASSCPFSAITRNPVPTDSDHL